MLGRREQRILIGGLTLLVGLVYWLSPGLRAELGQATSVLASGDVGAVREYILSFGVWAPVVSGLLMVLQSLVAPLPAFVITFANGLLFGAFWGTILSWSSAMVGAALCFSIARALGRPAVERVVGAKSLGVVDRFFQRYGRHSILIARLIPVVSFDVVSYAAGTTSIGFLDFMVATGVGQLPATVLYSILGENLTSTSRLGLWVFGVVIALLVLGMAVKTGVERKLAQGRSGARRG